MEDKVLESMINSNLQKKIVELLEKEGPMTRADMVEQLHMPRTTIYDSLVKLIGRNIVDKYPVDNNRRGRPKIFFTLKGCLIGG